MSARVQEPPIRSYIHYDPERTDYSLTGEELKELREGGQNLWKDVCLVAVSVGIPCLINAIAETIQQSSFALTLSMFLNYLVGVLGLALGVVFSIAWRRSHRSLQSLIDAIKHKPKMQIVPDVVNVGALPIARVAEATEAYVQQPEVAA
ncbi:MAG: hypothetical protein FJY85_11830 [Deltaproteobacteria bacterium]|nr:hypothetical protein [Deltaproteobacteria bacterium]